MEKSLVPIKGIATRKRVRQYWTYVRSCPHLWQKHEAGEHGQDCSEYHLSIVHFFNLSFQFFGLPLFLPGELTCGRYCLFILLLPTPKQNLPLKGVFPKRQALVKSKYYFFLSQGWRHWTCSDRTIAPLPIGRIEVSVTHTLSVAKILSCFADWHSLPLCKK